MNFTQKSPRKLYYKHKNGRNMEKLAENIKFYRKSLGLTQKELAKLLYGKKSLISNYENNYSCPDISTLIKLADIFEITLDELVGRKF